MINIVTAVVNWITEHFHIQFTINNSHKNENGSGPRPDPAPPNPNLVILLFVVLVLLAPDALSSIADAFHLINLQ